MDEIDRAILTILRDDARISFRDLGERVNLSANAAAERVRRLEREGIVRGYTALVDPAAQGRGIVALIDVRLAPGTTPEIFEPVVTDMDVVVDACHVTGRFDYQVRVNVTDAMELDATIRRLKKEAGVVETDTRLALRVVVDRRAI